MARQNQCFYFNVVYAWFQCRCIVWKNKKGEVKPSPWLMMFWSNYGIYWMLNLNIHLWLVQSCYVFFVCLLPNPLRMAFPIGQLINRQCSRFNCGFDADHDMISPMLANKWVSEYVFKCICRTSICQLGDDDDDEDDDEDEDGGRWYAFSCLSSHIIIIIYEQYGSLTLALWIASFFNRGTINYGRTVCQMRPELVCAPARTIITNILV